MTILVAAPMFGRPYPYWVEKFVWSLSDAEFGLPGHWRAVAGVWVCGITAEAVSIITCLTSLGVSGAGRIFLSTASRPADCTMPIIDAMKGVPPDVVTSSPLNTLCVP